MLYVGGDIYHAACGKLDRLLAQNEQLASSSAVTIGEVDPEARELSDDELELLAAAMGDYFTPEDRRF